MVDGVRNLICDGVVAKYCWLRRHRHRRGWCIRRRRGLIARHCRRAIHGRGDLRRRLIAGGRSIRRRRRHVWRSRRHLGRRLITRRNSTRRRGITTARGLICNGGGRRLRRRILVAHLRDLHLRGRLITLLGVLWRAIRRCRSGHTVASRLLIAHRSVSRGSTVRLRWLVSRGLAVHS